MKGLILTFDVLPKHAWGKYHIFCDNLNNHTGINKNSQSPSFWMSPSISLLVRLISLKEKDKILQVYQMLAYILNNIITDTRPCISAICTDDFVRQRQL